MTHHRSRLCHLVIDCDDLDRAVAFWSAALDATEEPLPEPSRHVYRRLRLPDAKIRVLLQRTDDVKVSKERMHLDLETDDAEAEVQRLEALGATRWDHQQERGYDFWVLRDPFGNEFCVLQPEFPELLARRSPWRSPALAEGNSRTASAAFVPHFLHLLLTAHQARNRTKEAITENPESMPADALVTIVFSAAGVEAFINELAEEAQRDADDYGPGFRNTDTLQLLAMKITAIDNDRPHDQVQGKYLEASRILSGKALDKGTSRFQDFDRLIKLRHLLVHPRHQDEMSEGGHISSRPRVVGDLQQRGLTRTRGRAPDDTPGGMSWLNELETTEIAKWAYKAAVGIVRAIGNMLPSNETATAGIRLLQTMIAQLPIE